MVVDPNDSETALLMHDYFTQRGIRENSSISLVMPLGSPIPPSPAASEALLVAFADRDIAWHPDRLVKSLDPQRKDVVFGNGSEMPYDLFLGVPRHLVPTVGRACPERLRGGRRDQRWHPEGGDLRRGARPRSSPSRSSGGCEAVLHRQPITGTGSATSSSATIWSHASM